MSNFLEDAYFTQQPISVLATYDSTSVTSGALLTEGGLGVKLSANIGEQLTVNSVNITPSLGDIVFEREKVLTNDISNATVGDFYFHNDITKSFKAVVSVHVNDSPNEKNAIFTLNGTLKPSGWSINSTFTGDVTGIKFSINNTTINGRASGEILYTNSNTSGTTTIRFKANTLSPSGATNDAGSYSTIPTTLNAIGIDYTPTTNSNWEVVPTSTQNAIDELADRMTNIKFEYEYYVSKDGDDSTGNGSLEKPYLTISQALTEANNELDSAPVVINISPGQYNENLTIIKPNIALKASVVGSTKTTRINGRVTIDPRSSTGGVFANYYTFENLSIVSGSTNVMEYTGNHTGYLYIRECMLYTSTAGVKGLVFSNTTSAKVNISKTDINIAGSGNSNAIYTEAGSGVNGSFYNCNIYGKTVPTISINGSENIAFNYSYIDNTGTNVIELKNNVVAYFSYCTIANYQLNSNGFNISNATSLILSHCIFNIPTNVSYNPLSPGSPPATTVGYAVKGPASIGSNIVYGSCLFTPVSLVGSSYYWGTKSISNTINVVQYNTTFSAQA
jgi:hypothetical protein